MAIVENSHCCEKLTTALKSVPVFVPLLDRPESLQVAGVVDLEFGWDGGGSGEQSGPSGAAAANSAVEVPPEAHHPCSESMYQRHRRLILIFIVISKMRKILHLALSFFIDFTTFYINLDNLTTWIGRV